MSNYKSICVLGSSTAEGYFDEEGLGWANRLSQYANKEKPGGFYISNYAVSGHRSFDIYHSLCNNVIPKDPDILLIACGANDLIRWHKPDAPTNTSRGLQAEFWELTLSTAKKHVKDIHVLGLLPVIEERFPGEGIFNWRTYYKNDDIEDYNLFLENACKHHNVNFIHMSPIFGAVESSDYMADGIHPNAKGHDLYAKYLYKMLQDRI